MNIGKQFKEGMITNNPVLVQLLGMCSTMAITTSFFNGLGMGVAVIIILTLSNVLISAMRKIIPDKIRIAMFIVVIAGFVTCVDLLLQAFVPALSESLGVFIPLIVVNCIILGRAEAFSYKNGIAASFFDGIFQGVGYTVVLVIMCVIRELLGSGTFGGGLLNGGQGIRIIPEQFGIKVLTLPVGEKYRALYAAVAPEIPTLKSKLGKQDISDVELFFRALYAVMLYRIKGDRSKENDIRNVIGLISPAVAELATVFHAVERGETDLFGPKK